MINMNFIVLFSLPMRSPRRRRSSVSRSCRADLDMLVVRDLRRILGSVEVRSHALGALTPETIAAQLSTNLVMPILLAQAALPRAATAGGVGRRIVNVSASVGQRAWPGCSVYAATKTALELLTSGWAIGPLPVDGLARGISERHRSDASRSMSRSRSRSAVAPVCAASRR
ncbi:MULTISPECIES: SDR family NAD(P)-dependent oxidoreductase [unclassified Streptomyces]|uniref:SDR family NAD(P)-dependent oxidoreductase n=1 Tax=unclassified Streptomyces TaxID=2593676 RepID=UPI0037F6AC56